MKVEAFEQPDLKFLPELQPADWADIIPHHRFYLQSSFCFPLKVTIQNTLAGIGVTIVHNDVAWLAHIIVRPEYRNKGLGKLITQTLVKQAEKKNCETVYLIATELGAPVYQKTGFVTETEYLGFKDGKIETSPANENIVPFKEKHLPGIFELDRIVTGENRSFRLQLYLRDAVVYEVNNKVEGYYLPAFAEGLVVAVNTDAGIALTKLRLQKNNNVRCPKENEAAVSFFRKNNYQQYLSQKRMRLGKARVWHPANLYSRTGGQVG